jgi:hypothetical protein
MRVMPFWAVVLLAVVTWLAAVILFYGGLELPMPPIRVAAVSTLFYLPSLVVGIWAWHPSTALAWSRARLLLTCVLGPLVFLPFALLTLPLLRFTFGAIVLPVAILVVSRHDKRVNAPGSSLTTRG